MKSLITKYRIPLKLMIDEPVYFLNLIAVRYVYKDGNRTDQVAGNVYTVTNTETFDQINILVENPKPLIPIDEFEALRESGEKVFVTFENATIRPYYNERTRDIQDSIKATKVSRVEVEQ